MKVVLVHDWLFHMRGGEKVLEAIAELYPEASIYTLFYNRKKLSSSLKNRTIHASFLQFFPGIRNYYRWLLPFFPFIIKTLRLEPADVVISTSHCAAKAVTVPPGALHVCYCHTPMRYIWGFGEVYFSKMPFFVKPLLNLITNRLRKWDISSNKGVDHFIANSENVRKRIQEFYKREADVIHPPLDADFFKPAGEKKDFFLVVSAFVPYKRIDLVIEAFNGLDRPLLVVGSGPLEKSYRALRKSGKIAFLGGVPDGQLRILLSQAKAVIFPTDEDFGIVPLEAQACGTPVIAYRKGGALESVKSGLFFDRQTPASLREAVAEFEKASYDPAEVSSKVQDFSKQRFKEKLSAMVSHYISIRNSAHETKAVKTLS